MKKVMDKIQSYDEKLHNTDNSEFLIQRRMKEDEKKRKIAEAFAQKEENIKMLEDQALRKKEEMAERERKIKETLDKKKQD
jgi:hypothetical protein